MAAINAQTPNPRILSGSPLPSTSEYVGHPGNNGNSYAYNTTPMQHQTSHMSYTPSICSGGGGTIDPRNHPSDDSILSPSQVMVVMDSMPKHEYYLTLRQSQKGGIGGIASRAGSVDVLDTRTIGSRAGLNQGTLLRQTQQRASPALEKPSKKFQRVNGRQGIPGVRCPDKLMQEFKPSNKAVSCIITLLDGRETTFEVDRDSYGQHVFDTLCDYLYLEEPEYFSLTFLENKKMEVWLAMDKRVKEQIPKSSKTCWYFQLRVRFYPYELDGVKDFLTQHLVCTQVRQDLVTNALPCSFFSRVALSAIIIQSEGGDYDPQLHGTIEYLLDQPLAPAELQTREFLLAVRDTHRTLGGLSPEEADRLFLENARKLALYGMHFHNAKNSENESVRIGVNHNGLAVYRDWLRISRFTWASMLKFSFKNKKFILTLRGANKSSSSSKGKKSNGKDSADVGMNNPRANNGAGTTPSKSSSYIQVELQWKCSDESVARRLYTDCLHHHQFFRLRESRAPSRPVLLPGYNTRKYTVGRHGESIERFATLGGHNSGEQYRSILSTNSSLIGGGGVRRASYQQSGDGSVSGDGHEIVHRRPARPMGNSSMMSPSRNGAFTANSVIREEGRLLTTTPESNQQHVNAGGNQYNEQKLRPDISRYEWRLSTGDKTDQAIVCSDDGTVVYAPAGCGWQGVRASHAIRLDNTLGPQQQYYYEAVLLTDSEIPDDVLNLAKKSNARSESGPMLRVGWSTQSASLLVGQDNEGFAYGTGPTSGHQDYCTARGGHSSIPDDLGEQGVKASHGVIELYGRDVRPGDIIGCQLDLGRGEIYWTLNGQNFDRAYTLPNSLRNEAFFPAVTVQCGGAKMNFKPSEFRYPPTTALNKGDVEWKAVSSATNTVVNSRPGWRMNAWDCTDACELSPDGHLAQGAAMYPWEAASRANQGIQGPGRFYYEARMLESSTRGWRVGYSSENASFQLGRDHSYAVSIEPTPDHLNVKDPQGMMGRPLTLLYNGSTTSPCHYESSGETVLLHKNDVVGVLLDLPSPGSNQPGYLHFSVNGNPIKETLNISDVDLREPLFPATSLCENTVQFNFGERPFNHKPPVCTENWTRLTDAPTHQITLSRRRGNTRRLKGFSYIMDPVQMESAMAQNMNLESAPHIIRPVSFRRPDPDAAGGEPLSPARQKYLAQEQQNSAPMSQELAARLQKRRSQIEAAASAAATITTTTTTTTTDGNSQQSVIKSNGSPMPPASQENHLPQQIRTVSMISNGSGSEKPLPPVYHAGVSTVISNGLPASAYGIGIQYPRPNSQFTEVGDPAVNAAYDFQLDAAIRFVLDLPTDAPEVSSVLERVEISALRQ